MKVSSRALAALVLLFAAACTTTKAGPPPPAPPVIKSFTADQTQVSPGAMVKLTFTTADAKEVSLIDQSGMEVPVTGSVEAGQATVMPTRTSFYVLRVTGEGGKDSAFVQVAVNEGLKQVFLIAVPTEISSGESVELVWSALGGANVSVKDSSGMTVSTDESGTKSVTPEKTTTWTLRADGSTGMLSATARVTVRPVIKEFSASPPAARQGQKIQLQWRTGGADGVSVKEATFGELLTTATDVATGSYAFTVPADFGGPSDGGTLPDGGAAVARPVPDNFPLRFTLTATSNSPMQVVSASLDSVVRDGPVINTFDAPAAVTENKPFTLKWNVSAFRTQLLLNGAPVFATVPPASASSSLALPGITADTTVTLVAFDYLGLKSTQSKLIKVVKAPKVVTFTLPTTVATAGGSASAAWTTTDASLLVLRIKDGSTVFTTSTAAQLAAGMANVYPSRTTTYVLEAHNPAGEFDTLEKTVTVATPATATATPNPTAPNTNVQLDWDISGLNPAEVVGIPSETVQVTAMSANFVDLENVAGATKVYFADRGEGTAALTAPQGFRFPFLATHFSAFTVGVNGFLALAPTTGSTLVTNVDLKAATGLPTVPLIAPFWDNLDLGIGGEVYWALDGAAFPRRLIVQWNKVQVGSDPTSDLTFQVQLFETGEARFIYKTLQDAAGTFAQGQSATVGIFAGATVFAAQHSFNNPTLIQGQELTWFTLGAATGTATVKVGTTGLNPGFFYKTGAGAWVQVGIPVRVFGINSVRVNETMPVPNAGAVLGQYVELFNPQTVDLDVSGLQLIGSVTPTPGYTLPPGTILPAKGFLVLGQSVDPAQNGEAQVTVAYGSDVPFTGGADGVKLQIPGTAPFEISKLLWTTAVAGEAVQLDAAIGTLTCIRTQKFGALMSVGTPGKPNETCFVEYTVEKIPVAMEDISTSATPLFSTSFWDGTTASFTLPKPFMYFGAAKTSVIVGSNGFLHFGTSTATATLNRTTPSTSSQPVGAIAPFWDDLTYNGAVGAPVSNAYEARAGDHHIIMWNRVTNADAASDDDLTFEVKLFDNGNIEFHYGQMQSGTADNYGNGNSATVWIERTTGTAALPLSINEPTVEPFSAWRFIPKP